MSDTNEEMTELRDSMVRLRKRLTYDPSMRKQISRTGRTEGGTEEENTQDSESQVELLRSAGISAAMLAALLREEGGEGIELADALAVAEKEDEPGDDAIIINGNCIGKSKVGHSCRSVTLEIQIKVKCRNSIS